MTRTPFFAAQRGQALTELVVMCLVLVPLFLLMPVVAKYQDISYATQMASRYVAFDAMTRNDGMSSWKPVSQLEDEVRRRYFSNSDAPIKTGDTAGDFNANRNRFWSDQNGGALISKFSDVRVTFGAGAAGAAQSDGYAAASDDAPFSMPVPINVRDQLELKANGVFTANVSVTLANLPAPAGNPAETYEPFKNIGLTIRRATSVAVDTWTASGPGQVESRIDQTLLTPGKALRPFNGVVDDAVKVTEMTGCFPGACNGKGPKLGELAYWRDEVPVDRLK
ncbi:hypothetical protein [Pseudoduganella aquatica]|uniref:hypothetical protein n=1 Tax=Pseudoduganella aquatica TaxID=2660641 RepID=UPI001E4CCCA0|nr:hypothetical protein [Pseudoduganella aquatica]